MTGQMMAMPLIISSLINHAEKYHGETEIVSVDTSGDITRTNWKTIAKRSRQLASKLQALGLNQGDCCATLAWNNHRHLEVYFGTSGQGLICHTINPRLFPAQLVYIINHAQDKILFLDKTFLPIISMLVDRLPSIKTYLLLDGKDAEA